MIDCLIAFKNISLITWRQQAERDIFYEAQRVLSIATQDGVVSKFLLKNNLATFATSDKKWNTLAIVAEGPIFAIYCSYCTQIYSEYIWAAFYKNLRQSRKYIQFHRMVFNEQFFFKPFIYTRSWGLVKNPSIGLSLLYEVYYTLKITHKFIYSNNWM